MYWYTGREDFFFKNIRKKRLVTTGDCTGSRLPTDSNSPNQKNALFSTGTFWAIFITQRYKIVPYKLVVFFALNFDFKHLNLNLSSKVRLWIGIRIGSGFNGKVIKKRSCLFPFKIFVLTWVGAGIGISF
jgi:hypothetical protein